MIPFFKSWSKAKTRGQIFPSLKTILQTEGPITIERYMETVLHDAEYGYYKKGEPVGVGRDFVTAPEISQMFGEILGFWCLDTWQRMGSPNPFVLLELGPGNGTMLHDLLTFTQAVPAFHKAVHVRLFEANMTLREKQKRRINDPSLQFCEDLSTLEPWPTLVLANEFFDTMPLRQFVKEGELWRETRIAYDGEKMFFAMDEKLQSLPEGTLKKEFWAKKEDGWVYETSAAARNFAKQIARHIKTCGGGGLFIDYGYVAPPGEGSLAGWRQGDFEDILTHPGKTDVTADVDFSSLCRWLDEEGVRVISPVTQGAFLSEWGIDARAAFLAKSVPNRVRRKIDETIHLLTSSDGMGELWKVLAFYGPSVRGA
ncbi:MAG: SAM-dependent methyltransferase [Alphaproteobacteria bacterium]|nr:SAM-dependent methyltransferase [Alphaproteobacteria bacterium]